VKKLKSFIIDIKNRMLKLTKGTAILILLFLFSITAFAQDVTLEYIFQDTNLVNPRPTLKFINTESSKMYYYADDDYDGSLSLFDYNFFTKEQYKYVDSTLDASEYVIMPNGDALTIIKGDVFISKDFTSKRIFTKDVQLTETDKYEYSPQVIDNIAVYRRSGNFYLTVFDSLKAVTKELELTSDESDSVSNQPIAFSRKIFDSGGTLIRILFARYDNSSKKELIFPNFNDEFVKAEKQKRGYSKVKIFELDIRWGAKDSLYKKTIEINLPDSTLYSTTIAAYSPENTRILFDAETRDRHNRKLFIYDISARQMNEIYSESDTAWYERHSYVTEFLSNDEVLFESEVSGYNNLYKIRTDGTGFTKIAGGNYTILECETDNKNRKVYFSANIERPYEYFIYETDLAGAEPKQITFERGDVKDLRLSGDGKYLFYSQSFMTKPDELHCMELDGISSEQITHTVSPKFSEVEWNIPELITFPNNEDGQLIHAFIYKPQNFNPKKKCPLICFVHGSGYLQNVTYGFSPYRDNFMVNTFLTQQGFMILDVDFRGSMGYGKDFRNKTYCNLGYWEVSDYVSGVNYLNSLGYIDKEKVGIYGGSYGGFTTLMAMFRNGDVFKCGAALRAVSDWKNYYYANKWYTLGRLGDYAIDEDKEHYRISSPITYAEGLQGPLLLLHGMLDDNVFFQQSVQLNQKLIDLKKDFEIMYYPKEGHNFYRQSSWLDQYKRIWKFFEKNLKNP
jgi:dipeptidyl aminopeptidase/acylaminoacyl peptidase